MILFAILSLLVVEWDQWTVPLDDTGAPSPVKFTLYQKAGDTYLPLVNTPRQSRLAVNGLNGPATLQLSVDVGHFDPDGNVVYGLRLWSNELLTNAGPVAMKTVRVRVQSTDNPNLNGDWLQLAEVTTTIPDTHGTFRALIDPVP